MMAHRDTRNLDSELFVFVIFIVRGDQSIWILMYCTGLVGVSFLFWVREYCHVWKSRS